MSNAYTFNLIDTIVPWSAGALYTTRAWFDVSTTSGGSGFGNGDTVTATGIVPPDGCEIVDVRVNFPEQDTNTTPTGTFTVTDATTSSISFIATAPLGVNGITTTGYQMNIGINQAPTYTNGVITAGPGYIYGGTENSASPNSLVMTITAAPATAATAGIVHLMVTYRCVGQ